MANLLNSCHQGIALGQNSFYCDLISRSWWHNLGQWWWQYAPGREWKSLEGLFVPSTTRQKRQ